MAGPPDDVIEAVNRLLPAQWSGIAFRHTAPGREALSGAGSFMFGGRWNRADLVPTIYLASPEETCLAEFRRMAAGQGRGEDSFLPRDLHVVQVAGLAVLDLTPPENLDSVGLSLAAIQAGDWTTCQEVGEAAHFLGFQGVVAPSAAGHGIVLAVFEPTLSRGQLTVIETRTLTP